MNSDPCIKTRSWEFRFYSRVFLTVEQCSMRNDFEATLTHTMRRGPFILFGHSVWL